MKSKVLEGSAQEITEAIVKLNGKVVRAIVYFDEPATAAESARSAESDEWERDLDATMATAPNNARSSDVSREAMYKPAQPLSAWLKKLIDFSNSHEAPAHAIDLDRDRLFEELHGDRR